jgi:hypothetical protein
MTQERPIRILQIIDSVGVPGAESWLMEVLRLWSKSEVGRIDLLATSGNPGIFDEEVPRLAALQGWQSSFFVQIRQHNIPGSRLGAGLK